MGKGRRTVRRRERQRSRRRYRLEQLEPRLALAGYDFGDAPLAEQSGLSADYPTLAADDGPAHLAVGPRLGSNRASSADGQPAVLNGDHGRNTGAAFDVGPFLGLARGDRTTEVVATDLNNDGVIDIVKTGANATGFTILLGNGSGDFFDPVYVDSDGCRLSQDLVVGDFSGDDNIDVVATCWADHQLRVLLGNGDGTFRTAQRVDLNGSRNPYMIAAADFDLDGNLDVATGNWTSSDISVLFGRGDGSFAYAWAVESPSGTRPHLAAGDIDGDGISDLAVADFNGSMISVLYSDGDRSFSRADAIKLGGKTPGRILTADVNADGRDEILTVNWNSTDLSIVFGTDERSLSRPQRYWAGQNPTDIVVADLDGDGILDLATASDGTDVLSVLMGLGEGRFAPPRQMRFDDGRRITAADVNGDQTLDLVASTNWDIGFVYGNGDGTFDIPFVEQYSSGTAPFIVQSGDFNNDGRADAALTTQEGVVAAIGDGRGALSVNSSLQLPANLQALDSTLGDIDNDGVLDVLVVDALRDAVSVYQGRGDGTFADERPVWLDTGNPRGVATADVNGDGFNDIVTANQVNRNLSIAFGDGDGTFRPDISLVLDDLTPHKVVLAEFNSDNHVDMAAFGVGTNTMTVALNDGDGQFSAAFSSDVFIQLEGRPITADVDGDGRVDILATTSQSVVIWWNASDGQFLEQHVGDSTFHSVGATDWNRDGLIDLLATDQLKNEVAIFLGRGDRQFDPSYAAPLASGQAPAGIALADLTRNGLPDAIVANKTTHDLSVLVNRSERDVTSHQANVADGPVAVDHGDLNGDGNVDLVAANVLSHDVTVHLGFGDGTIGSTATYSLLPAGRSPRDIATVDLDDDGFLDVVTANADSNNVSVLYGSGDGQFLPAVSLELGSAEEPMGLVVADLNDDGHIDVATGNKGTDDVALVYGLGNRSFAAAFSVSLNLQADRATEIHIDAADVTGDGLLDIVAATNYSNGFALLANTASGDFESAMFWPWPLLNAVDSWTLADLNGDDVAEFLSVRESSLYVQATNSNGAVETIASRSLELSTHANRLVTTADLTNDGFPEVVLRRQLFDPAAIEVISNHAGELADRVDRPVTAADRLDASGEMGVADLNHDGQLDLYFANGAIALGEAAGGFRVRGGTVLPAGVAPQGVAIGDLNGDGRPDVVTVNEHDLTVLLADREGRYRARRHADGDGGVAVGIGDVTGDGLADVVTSGSGTKDHIAVYPGRGDGRLHPPVYLPADNSRSLVLDDLNNDGRVDVLVGQRQHGTITVFRAGATGLLPQPSLEAPGRVPVVAVADVNQDGLKDVVGLNNEDSGGFTVFIAESLTDFADPVLIPDQDFGFPDNMLVGDFTGDDVVDVLTWDQRNLRLSAGNGDGTFQSATTVWDGGGPPQIAAGDVDSDGDLDVVVGDDGDLVVLGSQGDGSFEVLDQPDRQFGLRQLLLEDANADGVLDIVSVSPELGSVAILYGNGDGTFQDDVRIATASVADPAAIGRHDINDDGVPDLVTTSTISQDLAVSIGLGDGGFKDPVYVPITDSPDDEVIVTAVVKSEGSFQQLRANSLDNHLVVRFLDGSEQTFTLPTDAALDVDLNTDGQMDRAEVGRDGIVVTLGNADGSTRTWDAPDVRRGSAPRDTLSMDLNGDGRRDLAVANADTADLTAFMTNPDGSIANPEHIGLAGGESDGVAATGDFNGDGHADIVVGINAALQVQFGNGDGTFTVGTNGPRSSSPIEELAIADLNGDGLDDVVARVDHSLNAVSIHLSRGDGSFETDRPRRLNRFAAITIADVDGDGNDDIVSADFLSGEVVSLRGSGDGTFEPYEVLATIEGGPLISIAAADINDDGRDDLLLGRRDADNVTLLLSGEEGTFHATPLALGLTAHAARLLIEDVSGDQILDIVVLADFNSSTMRDDVVVLNGLADGGFEPPLRVPCNCDGIRMITFHPDEALPPAIVVTDGFRDSVTVLSVSDRTTTSEVRSAAGHLAGPHKTLRGDVDGDADNDIVMFHSVTKQVAVRLMSSDGVLAPPVVTQFSAELAATDAALLDLNQDGRLDVVIVSEEQDDVSLLTGNGDGTFQPAETVATIDAPRRIASDDFDGDGYQDVVIERSSVSLFSPYVWDGDGGLTPNRTMSVFSRRFTGLDTGDFNGDGVPDVVSRDNERPPLVSFGDGDGAFVFPAVPLSSMDGNRLLPLEDAVSFATGDLNADGFDEVVHLLPRKLAVHYGSSDGPTASNSVALPKDAWHATSVRLDDDDGDGLVDILVSNDSDTFVLHTLPGGSIRAAVRRPSRDGIAHPTAAMQYTSMASGVGGSVFADFDSDGKADLASAHLGSKDLTVRRGDGTFDLLTTIQLRQAANVTQLVAADINHDGNSDLLVVADGWRLLLGHGDGTFDPPIDFLRRHVETLAVADINGDGLTDVITGSDHWGASIWLGATDSLPVFTSDVATGDTSTDDRVPQIEIGEFNRDGELDFAWLEENGDVLVFSGDGSGEFRLSAVLPDTRDSLDDRDLRAADFTGDGIDDLAIWLENGAYVTVWHSEEGDSFQTPPRTAFTGLPRAGELEVGDVNGDGHLDLALASGFDGIASFLINWGTGPFHRPVTHSPPHGSGIAQLHLHDVSDDGNLDAVMVRHAGLSVLMAQGDDDGIHFREGLFAGGNGGLTVDLQGSDVRANYLDSAIDWNRDGHWDDEGETLFSNVNLGGDELTSTFGFHIPDDAVPGATYARFRVSSSGQPGLTGTVSDGEVEDYRIVVEPTATLDFGDAPTSEQTNLVGSYPTYSHDDGARHVIGGPRLGSAVDAEIDGTPSRQADGDDRTEASDEAGVTFSDLIAGGEGRATVHVTGAPGRLDAWIDFNLDGDWDDAGEQIATDYLLRVDEPRTLTFAVPTIANGIETYARFRVSTQGQLLPSGLARDGEVEDYVLTIGQPESSLARELVISQPGSVTETGPSQQISVRLTSPPDGDVEVVASTSRPDELLITDGTLTFTSTNWNVPQLVTITGVPDDDVDRDQNVEITFETDDESIPNQQVTVVTRNTTRLDFGNLHNGLDYPSSVAADGPRHLVSSLYLGDEVAATDRPTPDSMDNDGVHFTTILAADTESTASLLAFASEPGRLDAWVDFNGDGDWQDVGEQVVTDLAVDAGGTRVPFTVPAGAKPSPHARVRISTVGGLAPTGFAGDGEVEDYLLDSQPQIYDVHLDERESADVSVVVDTDSFAVTNRGVNVVRAPLPEARLGIYGTLLDDVITIDAVGDATPHLIIDGGVGFDSVRVDPQSSYSLLDGGVRLFSIEQVDLRNDRSARMTLDQLGTEWWFDDVVVTVDAGDTFDTAGGWTLGETLVFGSTFYRVVERDNLRLWIDGPSAWQNPLRETDVNGDGRVAPLDALLIINAFIRGELTSDDGLLPSPVTVKRDDYRYFDTNGDRRITPLDVLIIINKLSSGTSAEAEPVVANNPLPAASRSELPPRRTLPRMQADVAPDHWREASDTAFGEDVRQLLTEGDELPLDDLLSEWEFGPSNRT